MAHEAPASKTTNSVPLQRTSEPEPAADGSQTGESGGPLRPLSFNRLLSVAVLTPGQAALVAVDLLEAAHRADTVDGANPGSWLGAVTLSPTGEVDVAPAQADEGAHVSELLAQLLQNARRLPAHPRPEQLSLLHSLEETAGDRVLEPSARARELEGALAGTLGPGYRQHLSGQLAALVHAFAYVAPSVPASVDVGPEAMPMGTLSQRAALATHGSARPAARRAAVARVAPPRPPYRGRALLRRRRGWRVALVVLVLAAVVAGGYLLVRGPGLGFLGPLGGGNHPASAATTAPAQSSNQPAKHPAPHPRRLRQVASLAGLHAGPVTGVTVREIGSCKPGARCQVGVKVHLRAASTARTVGWKVGTARLCRPGLRWSPVTTVTARPGWTSVVARSSVNVPQGHSLALVAMTTTPARAQSRPIPVTGSARHC
jgi:hypothetical protein